MNSVPSQNNNRQRQQRKVTGNNSAQQLPNIQQQHHRALLDAMLASSVYLPMFATNVLGNGTWNHSASSVCPSTHLNKGYLSEQSRHAKVQQSTEIKNPTQTLPSIQQSLLLPKKKRNEEKKRKSVAQPRPRIQVPTRGIGPVSEPNSNDVLCGRGFAINSHDGNIQFRVIVSERKKEYLNSNTKKLEKAYIAANIVRTIRGMQPSGRFLKKDKVGLWFDIGDAKAIKKVLQALREDAPGIRRRGFP